jgi:SAM-dependent methyltransferase
MQEFWDERFDTKEYVYGKRPNGFFKEFIDELQPGTVLLPADGEGRNSVYAALKGWEVTAFDFSNQAKKKAQNLAKEYNVNLDYFISSIENFETEKQFDLIAVIFLHMPPDVRRSMHRKLLKKLKPGGYFLIECFSTKQKNYNTGGPRKQELLYDGQDLIEDLENIDIIHYKEKLKELDEGYFHRGQSEVIQLIGQRLN